MDFQNVILGFGFGGVAGAIIADMTHMTFLQTPMFILFGIAGAALMSGAFGDVGDIMDLWG